MVERGGLENRCACKRTVGSNPTPTATLAGLKKSKWFYITIKEERVAVAVVRAWSCTLMSLVNKMVSVENVQPYFYVN